LNHFLDSPIALGAAAMFVLLGCEWAPEPPAPCDIQNPAGPVVQNAGPGTWGGERELRELWRVGGMDEEQYLAYPLQIAVGPDGEVAVPDFELVGVPIIDPAGRWQGSPVTWGQGPGEVDMPAAAAWSDARELAVLDWGNVRVELLDLEAGTREGVRLSPHLAAAVFEGGAAPWNVVQPDGTVFVELATRELEPGVALRTFARSTPEAEAADTLFQATARVVSYGAYRNVRVPDWPTAVLAAGLDRWAIAPSSDAYEVEVYAARAHRGGEEAIVHFCKPVARDEVRAARARDWVRELEALGPAMAGLTEELREAGSPAEPALLHRMVLDRDGRVWVERDAPEPTSLDGLYGVPGARLDVFSAAGEFLGAVRMPEGLRFQGAVGDAVFAFEIGEWGEVYVVRLALEAGGR
jgi:hypothetical protein